MVVIKNYKMIAVDVNDLNHHKEFTDVLQIHAWMNCDENKDRDMDFVTPQEYRWLLEQQEGTASKSAKKPKRKKIIMK